MENRQKISCSTDSNIISIPQIESCKINIIMCTSIGIFVVFLFILYKLRKNNKIIP